MRMWWNPRTWVREEFSWSWRPAHGMRGKLPRVEMRASEIHGHGLFALDSIEAEQRIGRYEGRRVRTDSIYVLWVEDEDGGTYGVDGRNALRFLNHSSKPNAEFDGQDLYALRNIQPGEEICFHYGEEWNDVE